MTTKLKAPKFKVGQRVEWTSSNKTKVGEIVAVVPAGADLHNHAYPAFQYGYGMPREHESYIVRTYANEAKQTGQKHYWPVVSLLKIVSKRPNPAAGAPRPIGHNPVG
ncbi:hypothetical protein [Burkholderia sp. Bp8990]|uniref:hypothetical protein n=1 Tax=Burkholderia sp. Bp8990 TaxID=2184552 RepID=UPI000F59C0E4|nr:hypothetical protein [Burkholderia sp. Bp8990]RQS39757.1 hypothetical protein DIE01_16220 [Burkholderia sp. Bp8990]